ncbi:MAG: alanine--tRNA ligase, partial [Lachnospiraceae bacterium]|nr:alanine--tRNA ligase [Lachnospiraceae bacterium]
KDGYPELEEKKEFIFKVLTQEENQFNKTIDQGLSILADMEKALASKGGKILEGEEVFKLYDTYGFPLDLTKEILDEKGIGIDEEGFKVCMENQRVTARNARKTTNYMGADATVYDEIDPSITTEFVGYDNQSYDSEITVITTDVVTEAVAEGDEATIFVEKTPFYATMGGQQGDTGVISTDSAEFAVKDTIKLKGGKYGHVGIVTKGMFKTGDTVHLQIESEKRADTCKNHSATHLLQKALKMVLGNHVEQKGSLVTPDRLRFDFAHFSAMTKEELAKVEAIVNAEIAHALPVVTREMPIEEARKTGAMALFGEKYGDMVRVVNMSDFSIELCGGTHVSNTSVISTFKIVSESGIASGVRRIEALTGTGVMAYYKELEDKLSKASGLLKANPDQLIDKILHLLKDNKELSSENESLKAKLAQNSMGDVASDMVSAGDFNIIATAVEGVDMNGLRDLGDQLKNKVSEGIVVIASANGGKVNLIAMATDGAVKSGAHAGNLIKEIAPLVGGGGGGRPNMAQAGGKNPAGIPDAVSKAKEVASAQLMS